MKSTICCSETLISYNEIAINGNKTKHSRKVHTSNPKTVGLAVISLESE